MKHCWLSKINLVATFDSRLLLVKSFCSASCRLSLLPTWKGWWIWQVGGWKCRALLLCLVTFALAIGLREQHSAWPASVAGLTWRRVSRVARGPLPGVKGATPARNAWATPLSSPPSAPLVTRSIVCVPCAPTMASRGPKGTAVQSRPTASPRRPRSRSPAS